MKNHLYVRVVKLLMLTVVVTFAIVFVFVNENQIYDVQLNINCTNRTSKNKNLNNEWCDHTKSKNYQKQQELRIDILQKLVENDKKNGATVISGTNIEEFLSTVEKDNQKWNVSSLTEDQVKEIAINHGMKNTKFSTMCIPRVI